MNSNIMVIEELHTISAAGISSEQKERSMDNLKIVLQSNSFTQKHCIQSIQRYTLHSKNA